jgi:hypothetical protein
VPRFCGCSIMRELMGLLTLSGSCMLLDVSVCDFVVVTIFAWVSAN